MKVKEQVKKTCTFQHRSVAVDYAIQDLSNPATEQVWFTNRSWLKEGDEDKYEVNTTFLQIKS